MKKVINLGEAPVGHIHTNAAKVLQIMELWKIDDAVFTFNGTEVPVQIGSTPSFVAAEYFRIREGGRP